MEAIKGEGGLPLAEVQAALEATGLSLQANEGVTLVDELQPGHTLLARQHGRPGEEMVVVAAVNGVEVFHSLEYALLGVLRC